MPKVLVGLPTYDCRSDTRQLLYLYGAQRDNLITDVRTKQISALCWCFNELYCGALNNRTYDYFLLLHADIVPYAPQNWISKLIAEATNAGADLISVVSPIKNPDGLTSTALETLEHPTPRRVSMHEVMQLPQTFAAADVAKQFGYADDTAQTLLINTGCMLMDLRHNRDHWEQMRFRTHDDIVKRDGKFVSTFTPEDWDFSRQAYARGLRVAATRAVSLIHNGSADYTNARAWGNLEHDAMQNTGV